MIKLETKRLILRKPRMSDANILRDNCDDIAIKGFFMPYPSRDGDFKKLMEICIEEWNEKRRYWFILERKSDGKVIGLSGVRDVNHYNKTGYLSFWIFRDYRRKGYLIEANIAINDFCFKDLKLQKLKSEVATFNKASISFQLKLGMKKEGLLKRDNYNPYLEEYTDMKWFALFKEDWDEVRDKLIRELKEKG